MWLQVFFSGCDRSKIQRKVALDRVAAESVSELSVLYIGLILEIASSLCYTVYYGGNASATLSIIVSVACHFCYNSVKEYDICTILRKCA